MMIWKRNDQQQATFCSALLHFLVYSTLLFGWSPTMSISRRLVSFIFSPPEFPFFAHLRQLLGLLWLLYCSSHCRSHLSVAWAMVGDIFGRKTLREDSRLHEYVLCLGHRLGPVVAGAIWDRWQSYEPMSGS